MLECIRRADGRFAILHGMVRDTLFVVDISGGEGIEEQIMWIFGESTSQAKEEPVGGPWGEQAYETNPARRLVLLKELSEQWVDGRGRENGTESPDHKGTCRLWRLWILLWVRWKLEGKERIWLNILKRLLWAHCGEKHCQEQDQSGRCCKIPGERWWGLLRW